jgi:hypothetical protein
MVNRAAERNRRSRFSRRYPIEFPAVSAAVFLPGKNG